ncbi:MAG: DUF3800 domain-containing protein [Acidimicrobiales bacterium]
MTNQAQQARSPRPTSSVVYLDDSNVKASGKSVYVVGGIKVRRHGELMRVVRHIRDQTGYRGEFKFSHLTKDSLSAYSALVGALGESDSRLVACVTSRPPRADWSFYADVASRVIHGNTNRSEKICAMLDLVSTPRDVAIEDDVRSRVNKLLGSNGLVAAVCLDSRSCDGLQIADLVAGAVAFDRRVAAGESGSASSPKGRLVLRLKSAFGIADMSDCREGRVNILTLDRRQPRVSRLPHREAG